MEKIQIKSWLNLLGFSFVEGKNNILYKKYENYKIEIDLTADKLTDCKIDFGNEIKIYRETTSNFSQNETMVVLECVDRLLEKGYKPESIELEKSWNLGHKGKGFLDIFVKDETGKAFLMIECKTWGTEYDNELNNMLVKDSKGEPKGQLFSYFTKERGTKYLCLYASRLNGDFIEYENSIIVMDKDIFGNCDNDKEVFEAWNKEFENNGIFNEGIKPYNIEIKGILEKNLKNLTSDSGGKIFNQFAEILRRNVVSDKTNAFNKIFNLFICKIVDEDDNKGNKENEMKFQWKEGETAEDVLTKLNDLYKKGISEYLELKITDYSKDEIDDLVSHLKGRDDEKEKLNELITHLRLYKNNEFAFKEVFDRKTFNENAKVVKEIVKLLEKYRLRYSSKQQFLGDFFEKLLNTGIKQEAGQFFTPVPVAKFIANSIPFEKTIDEKIVKKDQNFLPYIIDYASGAGHFLTETMDRIDSIIQNIDEEKIKSGGRRVMQNYNIFKNDYGFASEFIYGIEKDYRLAKTTKVSCFLNGDGDANVICSDGLNSFDNEEYGGILKSNSKKQDNQVFDCLIANPPYSVKSFKNTIKGLKDNFELSNKLTDQSNEIECLFIERAKQLLKDGGQAGIILPVSILNNGGIYEKTRELILKYFDIKALVELGSDTFMATGTNTVVMFLERKNKDIFRKVEDILNDFFKDYKDRVVNGIENIFSKYIKFAYNLNLEEYKNKINFEFDLLDGDYKKSFEKLNYIKDLKKKQYFKKLDKIEQEKELNNKLSKYIIEVEKEKLLYFILTFDKKLVSVKMPSKQDGKDFLGYEFSNRKGYEGIKYYEDENGNNISGLFDNNNLLNPNKVNYYIYKNFLNENIETISEELKDILTIQNLNEFLSFDNTSFDKIINPNKKKEIISKWDLVKIGTLFSFIGGLWKGKENLIKVKVIRNSNFNLDGKLVLDNLTEINVNKNEFEKRKLKKGDLIIEKSGGSEDQPVGRVYFFNDSLENITFSNFNVRARLLNDNLLLSNYIFLYLNDFYKKGYTKSYQKGMSGIRNLILEDYKNIKIPLPPKDIQEKIVNKIGEIEKREKELKENIGNLEKNIEEIYQKDIFIGNYDKIKIGNLAVTSSGGTPLKSKSEYYLNGDIPWLNSGEVRQGYIYESKKFITKKGLENSSAKIFPKNTVLLAMYGATAGQVGILKFEASTNQAVCGILPNNKYIPEFLSYHLKFQYEEILLKRVGVARDNLSQDKIKNFIINLPNINIQKEIVKKIEIIEGKINDGKRELVILEKSKNDILLKYL